MTSVNEYQTFRLPTFLVLKHYRLTWLPCFGFISWWTKLVYWIFKKHFSEHVIPMLKIFIVRTKLWFIRAILQFKLSVTCSSPEKDIFFTIFYKSLLQTEIYLKLTTRSGLNISFVGQTSLFARNIFLSRKDDQIWSISILANFLPTTKLMSHRPQTFIIHEII